MTGWAVEQIAFAALDGSPRRAFAYLPEQAPPHRAALLLPGLALPGPPPVKGYVASIAQQLAARGVAALRAEPAYRMPDGPGLGVLDWHAEVDDGVAALRLLSATRHTLNKFIL